MLVAAAAMWAAPFAALGAVTARESAGNQAYWVEQVAESLQFPSSMAWLPNGDILILEREDGLRTLRNGKLDPRTVSSTLPIFQNAYNGLKDIARMSTA